MASAQDMESITQAGHYIESRNASLNKYIKRSNRIQRRLLRNLKRKEAKLSHKLAEKDSLLFIAYRSTAINYDSIANLAVDTSTQFTSIGSRKTIADSLKDINQFIQDQRAKIKLLPSGTKMGNCTNAYERQIDQLRQRLDAQQQINSLVEQRGKELENLLSSKNVDGLRSIQKEIYYAGEKIKAWKNLADDPDEAEEKAMEYLQGTEGFAEALNPFKGAYNGAGNNPSPSELERMGYQTKQSVNKMLQEKLGDQLTSVQQQMGQQVKQFQEQIKDVAILTNEVKQGINEGKQAVGQVKELKSRLKEIERPSFKKNPERGKPFWHRLTTGYTFQTSRAIAGDLKPAMLEIGGSIAFKHTPKLSYGIGFSGSIGLGRDWQNIHFSYEGIGLRVFCDMRMMYGFSFQTGYERSFRPSNRPYLQDNSKLSVGNNPLRDAFGAKQQSAYAGIMKRYRINSNWNGTFLLGYNFLWQESGFKTPFLLRFGWEK